MQSQEWSKFRRYRQTGLRCTSGKKGKERKERKERKESAAADLQEASVNAGAGLPTGQEVALIFRCQGAYKQRQQGEQEDSGDFKEGHGQEVMESAGGSLRRR
jgi:hypothetical protein